MKATTATLCGVLAVLLTACAAPVPLDNRTPQDPQISFNEYLTRETNKLLPPSGGPIPVAVYAFSDKTGQRKSLPNIASISSAVTQGADSYLIKALQDVGGGRWFIPVERVGLDNLIKERQMIRQTRELYEGRDAKPLPPMMFAGVMIEGGIIGYDSNTTSGGIGIRVFGIGAQTQYQSDTVTVNLRTVSVSTGQVLTNVTVTKTVLSYLDKNGILRFFKGDIHSVEIETGIGVNESVNQAVSYAIQSAVVETVREGVRRGHWNFKEEPKQGGEHVDE